MLIGGYVAYVPHFATKAPTVPPNSAGFSANGTCPLASKRAISAWTSLRNGFYAHSLDWFLGPWQQTGTITAPADGPVSWTDRAGAAEAAALILAGDRPFEGPITVTAPDAVTFDDIAQIASTLTGREIERVVVDDEQWIADQVAAGSPEAMARMLLTLFQAARQGRFAGVDSLLAELLGRASRSVTDLLTDRVTGQSDSSR